MSITLDEAMARVDEIFTENVTASLDMLRDKGATESELETVRSEVTAQFAATREHLKEGLMKWITEEPNPARLN